MKTPQSARKGFTLVELLATIAIMAVLIVAALPYVADYTAWARSTSQRRDAQVVAGAIARWIAIGGHADNTTVGSYHAWTAGVGDAITSSSTWKASGIIQDLVYGWTVVPGGSRDPFLAPNTAWTVLAKNIKIGYKSKSSYTVSGRTEI